LNHIWARTFPRGMNLVSKVGLGIALMAAACAQEVELPREVNAVYEAMLASAVAEKEAYNKSRVIELLVVRRVTTGAAPFEPETLLVRRDTTGDGTFEEVEERESESEHWEWYREELNGLRRDTYADFWTANAEQLEISLRQAGSLRIQAITEADLDRVFRAKDTAYANWRRFWAAYPKSAGLMRLSGVGFSKDRKQALVGLIATAGPLAGVCKCYLMARTDRGWNVVDELLVWRS